MHWNIWTFKKNVCAQKIRLTAIFVMSKTHKKTCFDNLKFAKKNVCVKDPTVESIANLWVRIASRPSVCSYVVYRIASGPYVC